MPETHSPARRDVLRAGAISIAASSYSRILGANERIRVGAIGTGGRCGYLLDVLKQIGGNDLVGVCDVYEPRRAEAKAKFAPEAFETGDHRALLDRKDIDAVVVATPDHWHVPIILDAVGAGKDVYCEKPVTHTLEEEAPLIRGVRESKRIVQIGQQQRSWPHFAQARDLVAEGRLGPVTLIRTYWYQNHIPSANWAPNYDLQKLDWKRFLGPVAQRPFDADQYGNWRWYWDFGGGAMTDLFVHWVDVAHWIMGNDKPQRATANGLKVILTKRQTPDTMSAALSYAGSAIVQFDSALLGYIEGGGLVLRGPKAAMRLWRGGFTVYDEIPRYSERPDSTAAAMDVKTQGDGTPPHMQNWLDCIKSRKTPNAPVEVGVSAAHAGHVANLALRGTGVWSA